MATGTSTLGQLSVGIQADLDALGASLKAAEDLVRKSVADMSKIVASTQMAFSFGKMDDAAADSTGKRIAKQIIGVVKTALNDPANSIKSKLRIDEESLKQIGRVAASVILKEISSFFTLNQNKLKLDLAPDEAAMAKIGRDAAKTVKETMLTEFREGDSAIRIPAPVNEAKKAAKRFHELFLGEIRGLFSDPTNKGTQNAFKIDFNIAGIKAAAQEMTTALSAAFTGLKETIYSKEYGSAIGGLIAQITQLSEAFKTLAIAQKEAAKAAADIIRANKILSHDSALQADRAKKMAEDSRAGVTNPLVATSMLQSDRAKGVPWTSEQGYLNDIKALELWEAKMRQRQGILKLDEQAIRASLEYAKQAIDLKHGHVAGILEEITAWKDQLGILGRITNAWRNFMGIQKTPTETVSRSARNATLDLGAMVPAITKAQNAFKKLGAEVIGGLSWDKLLARMRAAFEKDAGKMQLAMIKLAKDINNISKLPLKEQGAAFKNAAETIFGPSGGGGGGGGPLGWLDRANKGITGLKISLTELARRVLFINVIWKAWNATLGLFRDSIREIIDFDQAMKSFQAITVATTNEVASAKAAIQSLSKATGIAPSELANTLVLLGQAGFTAAEGIESLRAVVALSIGSASSLDSSVQLLTTIIRAYNMETSKSLEVANLLVAATNKSKLSMEGLNTAFNYAANAAEETNIDLASTAAALGVLADNGVKASTQGTGFRQVVSALVVPTKALKEQFFKLGINLNDVNPLFNDMGDILKLLRDKGFDATAAFAGLEKRTATTALALIRNADAFEVLRSNIVGTNAAILASETQLTGYRSQLNQLKQTFTDILNGKGFDVSMSWLIGALERVLGAWEMFFLRFESMSGKTAAIIGLLAGGAIGGAKFGPWGAAAGAAIGLVGAPAIVGRLGGGDSNISTIIAELDKQTNGLLSLIDKRNEAVAELERRQQKVKELQDTGQRWEVADSQVRQQEEVVAGINEELESVKKLNLGYAELDMGAADMQNRYKAVISTHREQIANYNAEIGKTENLSNALDVLVVKRNQLTAAEAASYRNSNEKIMAVEAAKKGVEEQAQTVVEAIAAVDREAETSVVNIDGLISTSKQLLEQQSDVVSAARAPVQQALTDVTDLYNTTTRLYDILKERGASVKDLTSLEIVKNTLKNAQQELLNADDRQVETRKNLVEVNKELLHQAQELIKKEGSAAWAQLDRQVDTLAKRKEQLDKEVKDMEKFAKDQGFDPRTDAAYLDNLAELQKVNEALTTAITARGMASSAASTELEQEHMTLNELLKDQKARIAGIEAEAKAQTQNLDIQKEQIQQKLELGEINDEDARVANLKVEYERNKIQIEKNRLLIIEYKAIQGILAAKAKIDPSIEQERRAELTASEEQIKALELENQGYVEGNKLIEDRIRLITVMQQEWKSIFDNIKKDFSTGIVDVFFGDTSGEDFIKNMETTLRDGFKQGLAKGIEEKLHFDQIFKGNILDLSTFTTSNLGGALQGIFGMFSGLGGGIANLFGGGTAAAAGAQTTYAAGAGAGVSGLGVAAATSQTAGPAWGATAAAGAAGTAAGTAGTSGMMAGLAAVPVWGWIALAAFAIFKLVLKGPMDHLIDKWTSKYKSSATMVKLSNKLFDTLSGNYVGGALQIFGVNKKTANTVGAIVNPVGYVASKLVGKAMDMLGLGSVHQFAGAALGRGGWAGAGMGMAIGALGGPIGMIIGGLLGGLLGGKKKTLTEAFIGAVDDILEPMLTDAFGTDIRIKAGSKARSRQFKTAGFGAGNEIQTGNNIISAMAKMGFDPAQMRAVQDALSAFGLVMGQSFAGGKGAALAIKLVNAALISLYENVKNFGKLDIAGLFEDLANQLGSFKNVMNIVNDELEILNKKIENGKSFNPEIYKELENAIQGAALIFADDFPAGVDVASKAIRQMYTDGKIDLKALQDEIGQVTQNAATSLRKLVDESLMKPITEGLNIDQAFEDFKEKFDTFLNETIVDAIINAGINDAVMHSVITPLLDGINELTYKLNAGEIDIKDFGRAMTDIIVRDFLPAMNTMRDVFDQVFSSLAAATGTPLEAMKNLFTGGDTGTGLIFTDATVEKAKQFTQYWSEAAGAAQDFYDKNVGIDEIQQDIADKQAEIARLEQEYEDTANIHPKSTRNRRREEIRDEIDALQHQIDDFNAAIDDINAIDLTESTGEFLQAVLMLKDSIGTVDQLIAYYSILSQGMEAGILDQTQVYNLMLQGIEALKQELPGAIDVLQMFQDSLDAEGNLDVNAFRDKMENALKSFNTIMEGIKAGVNTMLTSGDVKKGVNEFSKYLKKSVGDALLEAFINAMTNEVFMAALGPFFQDMGDMVKKAMSGEISFQDIIDYANQNLPDIMAAIGDSATALQPLFQMIFDLFKEYGLLDGYSDALDKQNEALNKQLELANKWQEILDQIEETRTKILGGDNEAVNALSQLDTAEAKLKKDVEAYRMSSTEEGKQAAAEKVLASINDVFDLMGQAGDQGVSKYQKGAFLYQQKQNELLALLSEIESSAMTGASQIELLQQQIDLLAQIADNTNPENAANQTTDTSATGSGGTGSGGGDGDTPTQNGDTPPSEDTMLSVLQEMRTTLNTIASTSLLTAVQDGVLRVNTLIVENATFGSQAGTTEQGNMTTGDFTFNFYGSEGAVENPEVLADTVVGTLIREFRTGKLGAEAKKKVGGTR